jgi:hypothetical protein
MNIMKAYFIGSCRVIKPYKNLIKQKIIEPPVNNLLYPHVHSSTEIIYFLKNINKSSINYPLGIMHLISKDHNLINLNDVDVFVIEISSLKYNLKCSDILNISMCEHAKYTDFEAKLETLDELKINIKIICDLLKNKRILFVSHFNYKRSIKNRETIIRALAESGVEYLDPTDIVEEHGTLPNKLTEYSPESLSHVQEKIKEWLMKETTPMKTGL